MKKGEISWVKMSQKYHKGLYHKGKIYESKSDEEKKLIGNDIYMKFTIENIKRNMNCTETSYQGKIEFC